MTCLVSLASYAEDKKFPSQFHGTWDLSINSCAMEYSDLRISIGSNTVDYWESSGVIEELIHNNENEISVKLTMSGEGEVWKRELIFQIKEKGVMLIEKLKECDPVKRIRCK